MPSRLEQAANRFRRELLANERAAASAMIRVYGAAWRRVSLRVDDLQRQIAEAQAAGEPISPAWFYQYNRAQSLQAQIEAELRRFGVYAAESTTGLQSRAVEAARRHSAELVDLAAGVRPVGIEVPFDVLPTQALQDLVGFAADGSPLREVYGEIAGGVADRVTDAMVSAVVTGLGPRESARVIRRQFGTGLVRALLVSRTETLRAYREATHRNYEANADVVEGWIWHATLGARTCFPAGTLITTSRGSVPIERVAVGDMVLTHEGRWRRVTETMRRSYGGKMVTVNAGKHELTCTAEHPLYVQRQGKLDWIEARNLRLTDHVICQVDGSLDIGKHGFCDIAVKGQIGYTNNLQAQPLQPQGFGRVALSDAFQPMPVDAINFKNSVQRRKVEINRPFAARKYMFLGIGNAERLQAEPSVFLRFRLASIRPIAARGTEPASDRLGWGNTPFFAAVGAFGINGWASTFLRAIDTVWFTSTKYLSTAFARLVDGLGGLAGLAACGSVVGGTGVVSEFLAANRAGFGYTFGSIRGKIALPATVTLTMPVGVEFGSTDFTDGLPVRYRGCTFPSVWVRALMQAITSRRTKLTTTSFDGSRRNCKWLSALKAFGVHAPIIPQMASHIQVYNLEVEEDHSYVANGLAVHNCAACWAMHGSFHELDERLDDHPNGRCAPVPVLKPWKELGYDIPDNRPRIERGSVIFGRLTAAEQEQVLGKAAYAAFADGAVSLEQFATHKHSEEWGDTLSVASLRALLGPERALEYIRAIRVAVRERKGSQV